ncbi:MAG: sarcosine oxidase [Thermoplasmata archaeon]|jgi:glycine/D-amino acid oxidase-like deaminating enzyme|nr:sarcosine oxidase [Thermoplasmata archaeon]
MTTAVVVGAGVMGLCAARSLARHGARVTVLDPLPRENDRNASNDTSKIFRLAYARDREMVDLAREALPLWRALEKASGATLLHQTGLAMFGPSGGFADQSARTLLEMGERAEVHEGPAAARFPFHGAPRVVVDPQGGWLDPPAILRALEDDITKLGGEIRRGVAATAVATGHVETAAGRLDADAIVVAAGPHAPRLLPFLRPRIRVTRQVELYLHAPADLPALPVFAALEEGFYGFPAQDGLVKIADHRKGPAVISPDAPRPPATAQEEATARAWLRERIPALADAPLVRSRVCLYDNTPDDRFILGPAPGMPRVIVAAGFSGHGFKFAPAIGERLAAMAR